MLDSPPDDRSPRPDEPSTRASAVEEPLDVDEVFHLLQTRRRRLALRYLRHHDGPVTMSDLAEQVAAWEHDTTTAALRSKQRQRVYIPLYQTHLPKLDDAGVIDYDQSRGDVVPREGIEQLYRYLGPEGGVATGTRGDDQHAADEGGISTSMASFGGTSLVGVGLVAAAWTGLIALPGLVVAAIVTAMFTVVTFGLGLVR